MKIAADQVMPLLLEAAPGISQVWREHLQYWGEEERGHYIDIAEFSSYLVRSYRTGNTKEFVSVFEVVEQIFT